MSLKIKNISADDIILAFKDENLNEGALSYLNFHKYRFKYLLELIEEIISEFDNKDNLKLLDIGPAFQTFLIRKYFPQIQVDTLGFDHNMNKRKDNEKHFIQDLNKTDESWEPENDYYDIITFCEVIEHLYTKPEIVLKRFYRSLKSNAAIIIQTPNAVAIHKRLRILFGSNPYDLLHESKMGHFREYTLAELKAMVKSENLKFHKASLKNYFNNDSTIIHKLFVKLEFLLLKNLRDGITLIATK